MLNAIGVVQNRIYKESGKTYKELVETKHDGFENGWMIENNRVVFWFSPTANLKDNPLSSPAKYVWEVDGDEVKPFNGRALELEK